MREQQTAHKNALRRFLRRVAEDEARRNNGPAHSKRRHERHLCMIEAEAYHVARRCGNKTIVDDPQQAESFTVFTKDISRSGISFVYDNQLQPQDIICMKLEVCGQLRTYYLRIVRCRPAGLKVFDLGGEFITEEEATSLQKATANR